MVQKLSGLLINLERLSPQHLRVLVAEYRDAPQLGFQSSDLLLVPLIDAIKRSIPDQLAVRCAKGTVADHIVFQLARADPAQCCRKRRLCIIRQLVIARHFAKVDLINGFHCLKEIILQRSITIIHLLQRLADCFHGFLNIIAAEIIISE